MGSLAQLAHLGLRSNRIGDAGVTSLADACAKGAMAQLKTLFLGRNQVGDAGLTALANACAGGAMASLVRLFVDVGPLGTEHPALKAACEARGIDLL